MRFAWLHHSAAGRRLAGLAACWLAFSITAADLPKGISRERYLVWEGALRLESPEAEALAVIVPELGGRVMRYEVMGENILWDNAAAYERPGSQGRKAPPPGGYQVYVASDSTPLGEMERLVYGSYKVATPRAFTVTLTSEPELIRELVLEKEITLDPEKGDLGLVQRLTNKGSREIVCGLRSRTQCRGGGFFVAPLNKYSRFRFGWTLRHIVEDQAIYDSLNPGHDRVKITGGFLIAQTGGTGPEVRLGMDVSAEWVAYVYDRSLFVLYFPYDFRAKYPHGGHTIELGWNQWIAEIEVLAPDEPLAPGKTVTAPMKWALIPLKEAVTNAKQARAAAAKVPPSPFSPARK
ncbi:MAG: hypothetical protein N3J91_14820 [Verrucomicrobiae bacterium]|nr:hypothetical protein [Verrucomicrobiae bacterium]